MKQGYHLDQCPILRGHLSTIVSWAFPNTVGGDYWSSTPYALATDTTAWRVIFGTGQSSTYAKNSYGQIRLVRGVQ